MEVIYGFRAEHDIVSENCLFQFICVVIKNNKKVIIKKL